MAVGLWEHPSACAALWLQHRILQCSAVEINTNSEFILCMASTSEAGLFFRSVSCPAKPQMHDHALGLALNRIEPPKHPHLHTNCVIEAERIACTVFCESLMRKQHGPCFAAASTAMQGPSVVMGHAPYIAIPRKHCSCSQVTSNTPLQLPLQIASVVLS